MEALSKCPNLQSLSIEFPEDDDSYPAWGRENRWLKHEGLQHRRAFGQPETKLFVFSGLQRLSLHGLRGTHYGHMDEWSRQILQLLLNLPQLKHISLSTCQPLRLFEKERWAEFFKVLCEDYAEKKGPLLNLTSLRL
jgi:hypothetical protein